MHDIRDRIRARLRNTQGRWYEIRNAADPERAVVRIYDEISWWGVTAEDFASDIADITAPQIEVQINSPGGAVFDGIAIYNALRSHPARVTTRVDGIAASIASVIAQAGDHRVMLGGSQMMIHDAWGLVVGYSEEMRDYADLLDRQSGVVAGIYAERSGRDADEFRALMAAETWLTAEEAVDAGLADEVVQPARQQVPEDKAPADIRNTVTDPNPEEAAADVAAAPPADGSVTDLARARAALAEAALQLT